MMTSPQRLTLADADATRRFACALAPWLAAGDTVLLSGDIGAGKTHFARSLIQSCLLAPEDVPSPTFTLVQTYDTTTATQIWHADLYRLGDVSEVIELGLLEAFETAICLVEWPDRLGTLAPPGALRISLEIIDNSDRRTALLDWTGDNWGQRLAQVDFDQT